MKNTIPPLCLRGWFNDCQAEKQMERDNKRKCRTTVWVWLVVIIAAVAAVTMDAHQRKRTASYRALPSADEQLLRTHMTIDEVLAAQERSIRREYGKIATGEAQ